MLRSMITITMSFPPLHRIKGKKELEADGATADLHAATIGAITQS